MPRGMRLGLGHAHGRVAFDPRSLPNLWLWTPPDQATSFVSSSGKISQWNDFSGNGRNLVQATGTKQPTLTSDAKGNYALFTAASAIVLATAAAFPGTPYTYYVVAFTSAQVATLQGLVDAGSGGSPSDSVFIAGNSLVLEQSNNGGTNVITLASVPTATNLIISASSDGSNNGALFYSPNQSTSGAIGASNPLSVFNVGNLNGLSDGWGGGIREVLVYTANHTAAQQAAVRAGLGAKYGIATS